MLVLMGEKSWSVFRPGAIHATTQSADYMSKYRPLCHNGIELDIHGLHFAGGKSKRIFKLSLTSVVVCTSTGTIHSE